MDVTEEDVADVRNWINAQPHLPDLPDDADTTCWLRSYLAGCKGRRDRAKLGLDKYFSSRSLAPELFSPSDPSDPRIRASVDALYLFPLPRLTPDGYRVHVFCHAVSDAAAYDAADFMRRAVMHLEWKLRDDSDAVGDVFVFHMEHSSLSHLAKYDFFAFSRFVATVTTAYPMRIKAIHFTLAPPFIARFVSNPFLADKIKKRIRIHGRDLSELRASISAECLPRELGGSLPRTFHELNEDHHSRLLRMREWLISRSEMKSDEGKRRAAATAAAATTTDGADASDLFGANGTFRTLNID